MPSDYEKRMKIAAKKADESYKLQEQEQPPPRTKTWKEYEKVLNENDRINPYYGGKKSKRRNTRLRKTKLRKTKVRKMKLRKTKKHNKK